MSDRIHLTICPDCGETLQTLEVNPFFTWTAKTGMQRVTGMEAQVCMNATCPKKWTVASHQGETITDCGDDKGTEADVDTNQ